MAASIKLCIIIGIVLNLPAKGLLVQAAVFQSG
jgi:hypothetical protein